MRTRPEASTKLTDLELLALAQTYAHEPGFVWLDSSMQLPDRGRRSLLARQPWLEIYYQHGEISIRRGEDIRTLESSAVDFLSYVCDVVDDNEMVAVGYIAYEACLEFAGVTSHHALPYPGMHFLLYQSALEYDHESGESRLTDLTWDPFRPDLDTAPEPPTSMKSDRSLAGSLGYAEYCHRVDQIKRHIFEGDIYQANFTTRFVTSTSESPFDVYTRLRTLSPAPYACYMNVGSLKVLSSSPERMLIRNGNRVTTSPIKGTIASGETPEDIERNRLRLLASDKDRAELLMIVDLERNDLGKIAKTGSVTVDSLFHTELYRSLIHLVSDISAEIGPETTTADILAALLPGGSITGAPKRRAIEILQELEPTPRGVYTGVIGYIRPGQADFNIAIRTITHFNQMYHIHAGGGIVADSDPDSEYREMLLKASNMFRAVGLTEDEIRCLDR